MSGTGLIRGPPWLFKLKMFFRGCSILCNVLIDNIEIALSMASVLLAFDEYNRWLVFLNRRHFCLRTGTSLTIAWISQLSL